jgi:hypothetical protein
MTHVRVNGFLRCYPPVRRAAARGGSPHEDEEEPWHCRICPTPIARQALKKAAEARQKRAALRADIKSGKLVVRAVMKKSDDPVVARLKVATLLESLPGYGKAKAHKIMAELEISESRRVQGLGARQRESLLERLG